MRDAERPARLCTLSTVGFQPVTGAELGNCVTAIYGCAHWRRTNLAASDRKQTTRTMFGGLARKHLEPEPFGVTPLGSTGALAGQSRYLTTRFAVIRSDFTSRRSVRVTCSPNYLVSGASMKAAASPWRRGRRAAPL